LAAVLGGMHSQTLRDRVYRFNDHGPDALKDLRSKGRARSGSRLVSSLPCRRIDLQTVVRERFGVHHHEQTTGKLLKQISFSHIGARPYHLAQMSA